MDIGRSQADKKLREIERKITKIYSRAAKETKEKLQEYLEGYKRRDEKMREMVKNGDISADEYKRWRTGQIIAGNRWIQMTQVLAEDLHNADKLAESIAKGYMPEVYAISHNWATYQVEKQSRLNTNYTLYDRSTVERMIRSNPKLLPDPRAGSATARKIAENKALKWNRGKINGAVLQGILQGEPIDDIANRLIQVATMSRNAAVRYARTMCTGAENAGRMDSYERVKAMGIQVQKVWLATLDDRTRDSHRELDGETRETDEKFSNGCLYPGDPSGEPCEVYNCRCTLITKINGDNYDVSQVGRNSKLGDMSYDEWKRGHRDE